MLVAFAHAPFEEAAGGFGVVVGFEVDAEWLELAAHEVGVGQRAVVHEAEILAGSERMRVCGRHRRLGGHAGVAHAWLPPASRSHSAPRSRRRADVLVEIDAMPFDSIMSLGSAGSIRASLGGMSAVSDGVAALRCSGHARRVPAALAERAPANAALSSQQLEQADLGARLASGSANTARPGGVRATIRHADQHRHQQFAEAIIPGGVLQQQSDDSTHVSEELHIAVGFPVRHMACVLGPFHALQRDELGGELARRVRPAPLRPAPAP